MVNYWFWGILLLEKAMMKLLQVCQVNQTGQRFDANYVSSSYRKGPLGCKSVCCPIYRQKIIHERIYRTYVARFCGIYVLKCHLTYVQTYYLVFHQTLYLAFCWISYLTYVLASHISSDDLADILSDILSEISISIFLQYILRVRFPRFFFRFPGDICWQAFSSTA